MGYKRKNEGGFLTSWGLIIGLFVLGFYPVALILMLVKLFKRDRREMEDIPSLTAETRYTVNTRINPSQPTQTAQTGQTQTNVYQQPLETPRQTAPRQESRPMEAVRWMMKSPAPKKSTVTALTAGGAFMALLGAYFLGDTLDAFSFSDLMMSLSFLLGGGAMLVKSVLMRRDGKRYAKYLPMLADREAVAVEELARASGETVKQVERDLQDMLDKGFFGDGAYLNRELGYLFRSVGADRAWQEEHKDQRKEEEAPGEGDQGYTGILRNIRRANQKIADPVLSAKIDQLEDITSRIFRAVEEDPKKAAKIDTFLNYYLPTTQKLLDSYAQFEAAGVEGENLSQAKARISSTMDMIIKGFSRQLDQLYQADAMDVDTDIRVMENMLRRDTRTTADDFFGSQPINRTPGRSGGQAVGGVASAGQAVGGGASGGRGTASASGGQAARFGQNFQEDFGNLGAAVQRAPEDR